MSKQALPKMQAPEGVQEASIEGQAYEVDSKGQVSVLQPLHGEVLKRHGFTDVVDSSESADDIKAMDRESLTEYIEERGGTVKEGVKPKKLKIQALNIGGFIKEAKELSE